MIKQQIAKLLGLDDAYKRLIQIELKQEQFYVGTLEGGLQKELNIY